MSMIDEKEIKNKLYEEFIRPTHEEKNYIGVEIEMPIINLDKKAVDFNVVHEVTDKIQKEFNDFEKDGIDYNGNIYSLKNDKNDDIICYDCSYNNIEFAMGREKDLFSINERFNEYYSFTKDCFEEHNHTLTGMGINPYRKYNKHVPIPSERYLMLYHHLQSTDDYEDIQFHDYPEYGMFSSASQVQLDISKEKLVQTINVFSKIEPVKALLFSNSVLIDKSDKFICFRDVLWEYSTHGINPHNIGMYDVELKDINNLQNYLESLNMYCVMRDGSYINFPSTNLMEFFRQETITGEKYCNGKYKKVEITPELEDIRYLRPFKFINLTFRGTVEFRSVCTQPISESMSVAAFHLGLKDKLDELDEIITEDNILYNKGYTAGELRKLLIQSELPSFINKNEVCKLSRSIVDLASSGLKERGLGEEVFLNPLYERIKKQTNPAREMIKSLNNKNIEEIIENYGNI